MWPFKNNCKGHHYGTGKETGKLRVLKRPHHRIIREHEETGEKLTYGTMIIERQVKYTCQHDNCNATKTEWYTYKTGTEKQIKQAQVTLPAMEEVHPVKK